MNYVHNTVMFLLGIFKNTILWLFNTELVNYEGLSISIGQTLLYFFIVGVVLSLLLNARFDNIGAEHRRNVIQERNAIAATRREFGRNVAIHNVKYKENKHLETHRY